MLINRIKILFRNILIVVLPQSSMRNKLLVNKYFKSLRFIGKNLRLENSINLTRSNGLIVGNNVLIKRNISINATAGVLLGNDTIVENGVRIDSVIEGGTSLGYNPVVIGSGHRISEDIAPGTVIKSKTSNKGLTEFLGQIVFIVSTGRSGSKAIASLLNQHPDAKCFHDTFPHIYKWSCQVLYQQSSTEEIKEKLDILFNSIDIEDTLVHGQSDQKLVPLIPILIKMFPQAKFIWLIREPSNFISSSYPRGWFDNSEFGYPKNDEEFMQKEVTPSHFDASHRTNGYLANEMSETEWKQMTAFERNCWYWKFWNNYIETELSKINSENWIRIKLEKLNDQISIIQKFLGLSEIVLEPEKVNVASYKKTPKQEWTSEMQLIFERHCRGGILKWYND